MLSRRSKNLPVPINVAPSQSFDGDDGKWSTFIVGVGTPPQSFRVVPSTQTSETWVIDPEGCVASDPLDCQSQRGGQAFNGEPPKGFLTNQSSTWQEIGLYGLQAGQPLGFNDNGLFGYDVVALNNGNGSSVTSESATYAGVSLAHQSVGSIASKDYFLGMLGLSTAGSDFSSAAPAVSTFLVNLFQDNLLPSLSYSYTAGASYGDNGNINFGSLVLGGYDTTRFSSSTSLSIPFSTTDSASLTIGVQSIVATNTANGTASMTTSGGHLSLIDSSVSQLWLPTEVCDSFASAFGLIYDQNTDLYVLNATQHSKLVSSNPSITFTLGQQSYSTGPSVSIVFPYSAFDYTLAWPIYAESTYYFPIRRANSSNQYRLGRTFLQEAHLIVDYGRNTFNVSQAAFPASGVSPNIVTIQSPGSASKSSISTGAIAGVAIGGILALLAILSLIFWLVRRRKKSRNNEKIVELEANGQEATYAKVHEVDGGNLQELPDNDIHGGYYKLGTQELEAGPVPEPVYEMEGSSTATGTFISQRTQGSSNGQSGSLLFSPISPNSDHSNRLGERSPEEPSPMYPPSPQSPRDEKPPLPH